MIFIKNLMNADQMYSYLMKLKLNLCLGPNSNYLKHFLWLQKEMLSLCLSKSSFIY